MSWDAVAGVDLETYARVSAHLLRRDAIGLDAESIVTALGVSPAAWSRARAEWVERITSNEEIRAAYIECYRRERAH